MNDTLVIALSRFMGKAEQIAAFLGADVREYTPVSLFRDFPSYAADRSRHVDGNRCTTDCSAYPG